MPQASGPSYGMHCMEIWGGNRPADSAVATPGLDVRVISRPLDGAGGDVHYVSLCGGGLITRILLADVSGHGTPVAALAGDLRKLIRRFINTKSQARLVSRLNDEMQAWSDKGIFATSLVATYLADSRRLTLSNAGHPRPLVYRAKNTAWSLLDAAPHRAGETSDLPLGIQEGTVYTQSAIEMEAGDRIILYTDLLIETHDRAGNALGEAGVLEVVRRIQLTEESVAQKLLQEILSNAGPASPTDDVTVLELVHNGGGQQSPGLVEKLQVYGKFFKLIPV